MIGRLPVQVKGTEKRDFSKKNISFRMDTSDLKNYLSDGGALLFVVYVRQNEDNRKIEHKIYYSALTPIELVDTLAKANDEQFSITLKLKELPENPDAVASILLSCFEDCKKQASFAGQKLPSLDSLIESGYLESLRFSVSGFRLGSDYIGALLESDTTYMYAKIKGIETLLPLHRIMGAKIVQTEFEKPVTVSGKLFYNSYKLTRTKKCMIIQIGEGFRITFSDDNRLRQVKYKTPKQIKPFIKDTSFILAVLENGGLEIAGVKFPLSIKEADLSNFDVNELKRVLPYWKSVTEMLKILHCEEDHDIDGLSNLNQKDLQLLVNGLVDGLPVSGLKDDISEFSLLEIGRYKFALVFEKLKDQNGSYRISDYFEHEVSMFIRNPDSNEKFGVPQYMIFHKDEFLTVSNMRFEELLPAFKAFESTPFILEIANQMLLDLIAAYDQASGERKGRIYKAALDFADWLDKFPNKEWDSAIATLNKLQIVKRNRQLDEQERAKLYGIIYSSNGRDDIITGAYLLLGDRVQAEVFLNRLDEKLREKFKSYPIYYFWENSSIIKDAPQELDDNA